MDEWMHADEEKLNPELMTLAVADMPSLGVLIRLL